MRGPATSLLRRKSADGAVHRRTVHAHTRIFFFSHQNLVCACSASQNGAWLPRCNRHLVCVCVRACACVRACVRVCVCVFNRNGHPRMTDYDDDRPNNGQLTPFWSRSSL